MPEDIHWLAESGQIDPLRQAIESGADLSARDDRGRTPLHVAVATGAVEAVRTLLDAGADPEDAEGASPGYRALHRACVARDATEAERVDVIRLLVERGAQVGAGDGRGATALHLVVSWCDADLVDALIAHGADAGAANQSGRTPLHAACRRGATSVTDLLLGDDGELAAPRRLHREDSALARMEDDAILESLVLGGAAVDAVDGEGLTPLHEAAEHGTARAVGRLLALGANPAARDRYDVTPLHRAAGLNIVEKLLEAGAALDPADRDGRTPLHRAIGSGRTDVAERLLTEGALAGIGDREGCTPLHLAASAGRAHTVERLLDAGADPDAQDSDGQTALQLARAGGHALVVSTLKKRRPRRGRGFPFFG